MRIWLLAVRLPSLTAAVVPVLVGTAVAADENFRPGLFVLALLGSMAFQAGTNLVNDYYDHTFGVDTAASLGPSGVIQRGLLKPRAVLIGALAVFALGAAAGITIAILTGWPVLVLGIASLVAAYAYTGPPFKLAYRALGEVTVFTFMGPVIVMGAAYVQTEAFTWEAFLASLPVGLLVASILHANNLRDIEGDREQHKVTLASIVGRPAADVEMAALVLGAFACAIVLIATGAAPVYALAVLPSAPLVLRLLRSLAASHEPIALNRVLLSSVGLHLIFGLLWALGYALAAWLD
ncbi:MAG: 1,4-dihydroxy-2-naphthoate octaprenyltransferase [Dehalococcoidia bacterium]